MARKRKSVSQPSTLNPRPFAAAIAVELPLADLPGPVYCPRHVQVQLDGGQALALKRLCLGLDAAAARLANGRRVSSAADALRYVLEELSAVSDQPS